MKREQIERGIETFVDVLAELGLVEDQKPDQEDPPLCVRCGHRYGDGTAHGPGFCIDRREPEPEDLSDHRYHEKLAEQPDEALKERVLELETAIRDHRAANNTPAHWKEHDKTLYEVVRQD